MKKRGALSSPAFWLIVFLLVCAWLGGIDRVAAGEGGAFLSVDKPVYYWGESVTVGYPLPDRDSQYELHVGNQVIGISPSDEPGSTRGVRNFDTRELSAVPDWDRGTDPSRAVFEVRLFQIRKFYKLLARTKFLVIRPIKAAPGMIDLMGRRRFGIGEEVQVRVPGIKALRDIYGKNGVSLDVVRLGRVVPGGAVEVDSFLGSPRTRHLIEVGPEQYQFRQSLPPAAYELRLMGPGYTMLDRVRFDVVAPPAPGALKLGPPRPSPTAGIKPPVFEIPPELAERLSPEALALLKSKLPPPPRADVPIGTAYDTGSPPNFNVEIPQDLKSHFSSDTLWLDALRVGRGGVLARPGADPYPTGVQPGKVVELRTPVLEPGEYEARLHFRGEPDYGPQALGYLNWQYITDTAKFRIGGSVPPGLFPTPRGPEIPYGDIKLVVEGGGRAIIGSPVTVKVTTPAELSLAGQTVWVSVHEKGGYTRDCARYEEMIADGPIPLSGGRVKFPAPETPGRYEIRLYRGNYLPAKFQPGIRFPDAELLAKAEIEVVVNPLPGALSLAKRELSVNEPVEVIVDIPADSFHSRFVPGVWRMPDLLPGGAIRPAQYLYYTNDCCNFYYPDLGYFSYGAYRQGDAPSVHFAHWVNEHGSYYYDELSDPDLRYEKVEGRQNDTDLAAERERLTKITARQVKLMLPPLRVPGNYEVRLLQGDRYYQGDVSTPFAVARASFTVVDPQAPPFPRGSEPRVADFPDWPDLDDSIRGDGVWQLRDADCAEPEFPEPPAFRVVQWVNRNPETDADDVYEPIDGISYGYPFLVEARFKTAPPEHEYRIVVGDGVRTIISRTADPLIYRSGLLVLQRGAQP